MESHFVKEMTEDQLNQLADEIARPLTDVGVQADQIRQALGSAGARLTCLRLLVGDNTEAGESLDALAQNLQRIGDITADLFDRYGTAEPVDAIETVAAPVDPPLSPVIHLMHNTAYGNCAGWDGYTGTGRSLGNSRTLRSWRARMRNGVLHRGSHPDRTRVPAEVFAYVGTPGVTIYWGELAGDDRCV